MRIQTLTVILRWKYLVAEMAVVAIREAEGKSWKCKSCSHHYQLWIMVWQGKM